MNTEKLSQLLEAALQLPKEPGVYIMRDKKNTIIYIGKAKILRNRVSSYFRQVEKHLPKVYRMVQQVERFDFIVVASEFEALVLEASMIKEHSPKYNILLKDDKGYSYFLLTPPPYSRIRHVFASNSKEPGELVGPYLSAYVVSQTMEETNKVFQLPTCNRKFPADFRKGRPCLNFHIKRCMGVCRGTISQQRYSEIFQEAVEYIRHGGLQSVTDLTAKMLEYAEKEQFEKAAALRDRIRAIQRVTDSQKVVEGSVANQDVVALVRGEEQVCGAVLQFRGGRLVDSSAHVFDQMGELSDLRSEFLLQYYTPGSDFPPIISLDEEPSDMEDLTALLSERAGHKIKLRLPQRGQQAQLVSMARANAAEHLVWDKQGTGKAAAALDALATALGLPSPPVYMESYDISNIGGDLVVGAMVTFENGEPLRKNYRRFRIETKGSPDDYASMADMLRRRLLRLLEANPSLAAGYVPNEESIRQADEDGEAKSDDAFARIPDLLLIDGGQTHVNTVNGVLRELGLSIPVFGLVKDSRHRTRAVAVNGGEVGLSPTGAAFLLLTEIQDETHRRAITYARSKHGKQALQLYLTQCPGIGDTMAKRILVQFRTKKALQNATQQELETVPRMGKKAAEQLYLFLHEKE